MSLDAGRYKLHSTFKDLRTRWEELKGQWNDPVSQAFDERYWNQLEPGVSAAVNAMDTLSQVLIQARGDCE